MRDMTQALAPTATMPADLGTITVSLRCGTLLAGAVLSLEVRWLDMPGGFREGQVRIDAASVVSLVQLTYNFDTSMSRFVHRQTLDIIATVHDHEA